MFAWLTLRSFGLFFFNGGVIFRPVQASIFVAHILNCYKTGLKCDLGFRFIYFSRIDSAEYCCV